MDRKGFYGRLSFLHISLPFSIVNGVVWGIGIIAVPLLAKTPSRAGFCFSMINLGIAIGSVIWGHLSHKFSVNKLVFTSSLFSLASWSLITTLNGKLIVPLSFIFGASAAGIFTLSSVTITQTYSKPLWEKYISLMQASMTGGTVLGLLITSVFPSAITGIPLLVLATLSYLPAWRHNKKSAKEHLLHHSHIKPKMHFSELFTAYLHHHFRIKHIKHLTNKTLFLLNLRWTLALLSVAPVYAIYPLLMKSSFHISQHFSSLLYALSTAIGVYMFVIAGKLAKKRGANLPFNIATLFYLSTFTLMGAGIILNTPILGAAGFTMMIFGWSFISVGMNISIVETTNETERAEVLGVANALQSLDNMLGGVIAGLLASGVGNLSIISFGLIFSLASVITKTAKKRR